MGQKREKGESTLITVNGEVMSVDERNRRMKLEFVNGGLSLKELADKYGLTYNTVRVMSCKGKWADYRKTFESKVAKEAEEQLEEIYVATKVEVNLNYNNLWDQLMQVAKRMLDKSEGILDKDGQISVYKLNQLADIIAKCHQGQMVTTGFMTKETQAKLDLEYRKMNIQEMLAGINEDDTIPDNFLDALEEAAKRNFGVGQ